MLKIVSGVGVVWTIASFLNALKIHIFTTISYYASFIILVVKV